MPTPVSTVLAQLRDDHRNIAILLQLLEKETRRIADGLEPDYELAHDIMRYMTSYPDSVHHPREDRIYHRLKVVAPDMLSGIDGILEEHDELGRVGIQLREALDAVEAGSVVRRDELAAAAADYVRKLRDHMRWEEAALFTLADELLADEDWDALPGQTDQSHDPVFGPSVQSSYESLYKFIRNEADALDH
ncbi:hemerythrin domain-containing protein [Lentisalinibacter salinarum]|uniref:hemerythrin domain-containing protein n=1 Tax=Lentisalinibacter salinarum TaxID=2992239 RepID=UPI003867A3F2